MTGDEPYNRSKEAVLKLTRSMTKTGWTFGCIITAFLNAAWEILQPVINLDIRVRVNIRKGIQPENHWP